MTRHQARRERREAERKAKKAEAKRNRALAMAAELDQPAVFSETTPRQPEYDHVYEKGHVELPVGFVLQNSAESSKRAEINRRNAQRSTGPKTGEGKLASSRNSLKHGLASGEMIIPGEDPAAFEVLLHELLEEHQPSNSTEELLINQMAQSYWLMQRAIRLQNECFTDSGVDEKRLSLFLRYQATHHRAFHKALAALTTLQKGARSQATPVRGFVSKHATPEDPPKPADLGFVSQTQLEPASVFPEIEELRRLGTAIPVPQAA